MLLVKLVVHLLLIIRLYAKIHQARMFKMNICVLS